MFSACPGVTNIYDDIVVYGSTEQEHDSNLDRFLKTMKRNNLTANQNKCTFKKESIEFFGFMISSKGITPTEDKLQAIKDFKVPKCLAEVRSFLGTVNYLINFIRSVDFIQQFLILIVT